MKLKASAVVLIFLLLLSTTVSRSIHAQKKKPDQPSESQTEDEVVRVSTTLVTVPVSIKDRKGKTIPHLAREDFRLFEDGVEQNIAYFESPAEAKNELRGTGVDLREKPLTIALLLDVSDSTQFKLKQIQNAATAFANQLGPQDRMLVMA